MQGRIQDARKREVNYQNGLTGYSVPGQASKDTARTAERSRHTNRAERVSASSKCFAVLPNPLITSDTSTAFHINLESLV